MPNKKLSVYDSPWINFMRAQKAKLPYLEKLSRRDYYPFAAVEYKRWKKYFLKYYSPTRKNMIVALRSYFDN